MMLLNRRQPDRLDTPRVHSAWLIILTGLTALLCLGNPALGQAPFVNFEPKQTQPIRLSPDGSRLFAVNTPDARLSVFDVTTPSHPILIAEIPVGIGPVSVNPINNEVAWVVNEVSDSVSVISVSQGIVTDTIYVQDEPADLVFAQGRAFVSASRKNRITVINMASHDIINQIELVGENPRAMAVNEAGDRVYAAFALSGNRTTIVPPDEAPPQPPPTNPELPDPPQVGLIVDAEDPDWSSGRNPVIDYVMPDHDVVEIDAINMTVLRYFSQVGTVNLALAVQPMIGELWVANTDARNLVPFEPVIRGNFLSNRVSRIQLSDGTINHFDLNEGFTYQNMPNPRELTNALAQPTAIAFGPSGGNFFVASFGTDRIARMRSDGMITGRIELNPDSLGSAANPQTKRGPRGLALLPGRALYVLNRLSNTLTLINPMNLSILREMPVGSFDPTPAVVRNGRGFLYDAKLSGAGTVSCASCHIDSEMDMIAWDLGDPGGELSSVEVTLAPGLPTFTSVFHPMKGPMTTQTLRGLNGLDPLHWRGDRTNFLHFNGAFDFLLGGSILSDQDMRAFRNFVNTIVFQPNPNQNLDRSFPTSFMTRNGPGNAENGRSVYINDAYQTGLTCNTCHALPTGSASVIIPAAALQESQDFKVPHLRNIYKKLNVNFDSGATSVGGFALIHDGIDQDLFTFLSRPVFGVFANDTNRKRDLDAFVQCFDTGMAPAVGYSRTLSANNVQDNETTSDWTLLENQVVALNIDLIAKGTLDGQLHGLIYDSAQDAYLTDQSSLAPLTRSDLITKIENGDTLTLMGVPRGTGLRMGVDRDHDSILDADEPPPSLSIAQQNGQAIISWPTDAVGFVLEKTPGLNPPNWQIDVTPRSQANGQFSVTNSLTTGSLYYRLRSL